MNQTASQADLQQRAEAIRKRVVQFRQEEAKDWGEQVERDEAIPEALWERMRELGFFKLTQPQWAGGEGLPLALYFPILEELAHCHGTIRMMFHAYNSIWRPIGRGREEQQKEWLPRIAAGEVLVAFALTEPDNGTGIDLRTTAVEENGQFILNGRKHLITFADRADIHVVIAKTNPDLGRDGLTAFLIPKGRSGMNLTPMPEMMGDKGCTHSVITFDNCVVDKEEVLGEVGQGFNIALRGFLDQSRASIAQSAVGLAQESLDVTISHVLTRKTFGKALASRQAVQMRLAEMATAIQGARLLCLDAAKRFDANEDISVHAAMAKANAIKMVGSVTDSALSLFGGIGYAVGSPVERLYRDARSLWLEEGTVEMQNMTIAESILREARMANRKAQRGETA
ncbi:acyl-CoA dehydrogenase family protein [Alicyclobacillus sp. SO9]|uniref:acyl-CoA dehydrogenase family protein n=1 Tax=Alicyclobacillus sp. SO9 TaxID=2665646 RepID=UPI0018E76894|nr:acyl-CoA dehydrogenase family protein [Alicyclobacillus sp. SO9]QQE81272.1 acyl-CoA dehydrogenase family protein [Alicyclobacillus sp. SO9]